MRLFVIVLSTVVLATCGGAGGSVTAGPNRVIAINMNDFFFSPALAEVRPGERVTFVLKNSGLYEHEFMAGREAVSGRGYASDWLAAASADGSSGHEMHAGVGVRVAPNDTATLTVVVPGGVGEFEFGCFIAGHYESGMKGKLLVVSNGDTPEPPPAGVPSKRSAPAASAVPHPMGSMGDDDAEGH